MLNRISALINEKASSWSAWREKRQISTAPGFCSISITSEEILILYATRGSAGLTLQLCEKISLPKDASISSLLSPIVEKYQLKHIPSLWVLNPKDYQLFQMETLPVPNDEFQSAIRWKLKGSVSFGLEDALIDKFNMPLQKSINAQQMMTVVVARESYVQHVAAQIKQSGLNLKVIDINELSLRNVSAMLEKEDKTNALLHLSQNGGQLIITRKDELYFSRHIEFDAMMLKAGMEEGQRLLEKLALELQRSFDYFHTQWRNQIPEYIYLVSPKLNLISMTEVLSGFLGTSVIALPLNNIIADQTGLSLEQKPEYLSLIGGLLREGMSHATGN